MDAAESPEHADTAVRLKVRLSRSVIEEGAGAVVRLAEEAVRGFERLLEASEIHRYASDGEL